MKEHMIKKIFAKFSIFLLNFSVIAILFFFNVNKNTAFACVCGTFQNGLICANNGCTCSNSIPLDQPQCFQCRGGNYDACQPVGSDGTAYPCCVNAPPAQTQCQIDGYFCTSSGFDCSNSGGTLQSGYGCTGGSSCCVHTPDCNTGIKCSTCADPGGNVCNTNDATGTNCYYSTYNNGNQFCNFNFTAPDQPHTCTYNSCNNGYSCISGTCYLNCNIGACGNGCADPTTRYVTGSSQTCGNWFGGAAVL